MYASGACTVALVRSNAQILLTIAAFGCLAGCGGRISGAFDRAAAKDLAALLAAGPLPAKLDLVEERSR